MSVEQIAFERIRRQPMIVVSKYRGAARKSSGHDSWERRSTEYASDETAPERRPSSERHGPLFDRLRSAPPFVTARRLVTAGCH